MSALKEKKYIYTHYSRKPVFLTKTNMELSNSMHSFKTVQVIYTALPMIAVATPTPASTLFSAVSSQK